MNTQTGSSTGRFTGSGSVMLNGRKVSLPSRWSHILANRRKPGAGSASTPSSTGSQSTPHGQSPKKVSPTSSDSQSTDKADSPTQSIQDTINPQDSDRENHQGTHSQTNKAEEPAAGYETGGSHSSVVKEDADAKAEEDEEDNKQGSSSASSTQQQSPSVSSSLPGRGVMPAETSRDSRPGVVHRYPPRQDGRVPWSRTSSSSVGNRRPIVRGTPSRSGVSETVDSGDKTRTASSLYPSKHKVDDTTPIKPSVQNNRDSVSPMSPQPPSTRTEAHTPKQIDNDHEEDDDYDYDDYSYDKVAEPTAAPKTTTSTTTTTTTTTAAPTTTVRFVQNAGDISDRRTRLHSGHTDSRRPFQGSNGRVRSPVVSSNRHGGSRFAGRLSPVQHTKVGSDPESSSSHSSAAASSYPSHSSRMVRKPSQEDASDGRTSSSGSESHSLGRQTPGGENSPVVRSAVAGSRLRNPSRPDNSFRGKPPVNGFKPGNGQGKVTLSQAVCVSAFRGPGHKSKNYSATERFPFYSFVLSHR